MSSVWLMILLGANIRRFWETTKYRLKKTKKKERKNGLWTISAPFGVFFVSAIYDNERDELSKSLLDWHDKGTKAEHRTFLVELLETFEDQGYAIVLADGEDSAVLTRPSMTAIVWLTSLRTTTMKVWEHAEATLHGAAEGLDDRLAMSLVKCYEDSFHWGV